MSSATSYPKISVVVPSYNQGRFIEKTLESIVSQNYPALELIVMDGGSTDDTVEIIKRFEPHITLWVSERDKGQTDALIKGFERATGDIYCWLNSDDLFEPGTLLQVAEHFTSHPKDDAVFGNAFWIDEHDAPLREQREIPFNRFIWLYTYNYIPGMSMFWRAAIYKQVGGLNGMFNLAMDADLWIRFAEVGRIAHVDRMWSRMRFYASQKNRSLRTQSDQEDLAIRARYWGTERPPFLAAKQRLARVLRVSWKLVTGCYSRNYKRYLEDVQTPAASL